jgi:hypothetical protein
MINAEDSSVHELGDRVDSPNIFSELEAFCLRVREHVTMKMSLLRGVRLRVVD